MSHLSSAQATVPAGLVARTRPLGEDCDPLAFLGSGGFAWLHRGAGLATSGVAARIELGSGNGRLARAAADVAEVLGDIAVEDPLGLPGTGAIAVGSLPFADAPGELIVPARVVGRNAQGRTWITEIGPAGAVAHENGAGARRASRAAARVLEADSSQGRDAWMAGVEAGLSRIAAGELLKVVLARQVVVEGEEPFDVAAVLDRLRQAHPSCFTFAAGGFLGATPELLVRRRGTRVLSRPMAGSTGRGGSPDEDDLLAAALASSAKDLDEHRLVVEAIVDALSTVCREVAATATPDVVRLATVCHLASTVAGRLDRPDPSALALAGLLHPTPAVGGLPRERALAAIAELEPFDRGAYAGPVGWVDQRGDGDWAVALRCARLDGRTATLTAGAGIVAGSDPDAEWEETERKLEPMVSALRAGWNVAG